MREMGNRKNLKISEEGKTRRQKEREKLIQFNKL
jgi:hypothetical protein